MGFISSVYNMDIDERSNFLSMLDEDQNELYWGQIQVHHDHSENLLNKLGVNYYLFYKILYQIWIHEDISAFEIGLVTRCKVVGMKSIMKRKYGVELIVGDSQFMASQINQLKLLISTKRKEENTKFILKQFFK